MRGFASWVVRRRALVVATHVVIALVLLLQVRELQVVIDTDQILPPDHPYIVASNIVERVFGSRFTIVVGMKARDGTVMTPPLLRKLEGMTDALLVMPGVVRANVRSLASPGVRDIVADKDGFVARPMMPSVPQTPDQVAALEAAIRNNPLYDGVLVSHDRRMAAVVLDVRRENVPFGEIETRLQKTLEPFRDDSVDLLVTGQIVYLAALERFSDRMMFLLPLAVLVIGILHYEAFRTVQGLVLPLVTALLSVLWGLGLLMLAGLRQLDPFSNVTPILIIAVAAGHAVQILKRYYEACSDLPPHQLESPDGHHAAVVETVAAIGPVMIAAGGIAAATFLSLVVFDIQAIRTFGLLAACGILSALVIELTFIPAIRAMLPSPGPAACKRERTRSAADRVVGSLGSLVASRKRWLVLAATAVVAAVMAIGATRVVSDSSLREFFTPDQPFRVADAEMNESLAGGNTLYLLIQGKEDEAMTSPSVLRAIAATQRFLEKDAVVGATVSIADYVSRMNRAMHGDEPAANTIPDSRDLVSQYLLLYSISGDAGDFHEYVDPAWKTAVIHAFVKTDSSAYVTDLRTRLASFVKEHFSPDVSVQMAGSITTSTAISEIVIHGKLRNIAQAALVVFLAGLVLFRSVTAGLLLLVPLSMVALVNFGLMGFTGVPLQIATATMASLGIGIGADYAIYFTYRLREELAAGREPMFAIRRTYATAGKASLYVAAAVGGGYATVALSYGFQPYLWMGEMVSAAMAVSLLSALIVYPALLLTLRPRFVFAAQEAATDEAACEALGGADAGG